MFFCPGFSSSGYCQIRRFYPLALMLIKKNISRDLGYILRILQRNNGQKMSNTSRNQPFCSWSHSSFHQRTTYEPTYLWITRVFSNQVFLMRFCRILQNLKKKIVKSGIWIHYPCLRVRCVSRAPQRCRQQGAHQIWSQFMLQWFIRFYGILQNSSP